MIRIAVRSRCRSLKERSEYGVIEDDILKDQEEVLINGRTSTLIHDVTAATMASFKEPEVVTTRDPTLDTGSATPQVEETWEWTGSKQSLWRRVVGVVWDSLDGSPRERQYIRKLDSFMLFEKKKLCAIGYILIPTSSYICMGYFMKYLDQTNTSA